jgi:hypothetical protein
MDSKFDAQIQARILYGDMILILFPGGLYRSDQMQNVPYIPPDTIQLIALSDTSDQFPQVTALDPLLLSSATYT